MKNLLNAVLTGIGIGIPITLICMICIDGWNEVIMEFLVWTVASALFGVVSYLTLKSEKLNLFAATAIHCVCCLGITLGAAGIIGYADSFLSLLIGVAPVFVIVYAVLYTIAIIMSKINAKRATKALNK